MNQGWAYTIKAHPDALEARTPLIAACSYIYYYHYNYFIIFASVKIVTRWLQDKYSDPRQ